MRSVRVVIVAVVAMLLLWPQAASATSIPTLVISQFKITTSDGQFFLLYNTTDNPIDMSTVQLVYYNHYNLANATSSKVITLSGSLPAHGYYLVNDGPLTLCYRMLINSLSLGLSTTAGHVEIQRLSQTTPGGPLTNSTEDAVSWSKTATTAAVQLPASPQFLYRNPVDTQNNPTITSPGTGSWKTVIVDPINPCLFSSPVVTMAPPIISSSLLLLTTTPPPVIIEQISTEASGPFLPAADTGLAAPVINELLPNPGAELSDAEDEFIELYNPNDKPFDLTGFQFEIGATTKYTWQFPDGTQLAPKSFTAFTSAVTGLSLSNTSGAARLLDPFGAVLTSSETYGSAKDDQAWALANGTWTWTLKPTPNAVNVINTPITASSTKPKTTSTGSSTSAVKAAATSKTGSQFASTSGPTVAPEVASLHPTALASVGLLALGYGAYEYKQDIANRLRQFRHNRALRRGAGR